MVMMTITSVRAFDIYFGHFLSFPSDSTYNAGNLCLIPELGKIP